MKAYKILLAGVCSMFMFSSCLEEFQKLNTNDEEFGTAEPAAAFHGATKNYNNNSRAHLTGMYSGSMRLMQYLVSSGGASSGIYNNLDNKTSRTSPSNQIYGNYYSKFGLHLDNLVNNLIVNHERPEEYKDIQAIGQILLNHQQWLILDAYGAAPILEAFKQAEQAGGIRTPKYDLYQKSSREDGKPMYKIIDEQVKASVATLKASDASQAKLGTSDNFYNGDVAKWIKFANTLRVKMAQRVELADPDFYNSVITEVLTSADNVIASNAESCLYWHPNDNGDNVDDIQDITKSYVASAAFVNFLKEYNDPRLPLLIRRNGFGTGNNNSENDDWFETFKKNTADWDTNENYQRYYERYVGMSANPDNADSEFERNAYLARPYTDDEGVEKVMDIRMFSQVEGRFFVKNGGDRGNNNMPNREIEDEQYKFSKETIKQFTPLITYPETCFMLAEIAVKKNASVAGKDATAWMREGIKASMEQYREWAVVSRVLAQTEPQSDNYNPITDEAIAEYLAQEEFQTATLEKIISQTWVELFRNPMEMWAVWKRTGLPAFKEGVPTPEAGVAFFEAITGEGTFEIPRRNALGTPNTLNIENYNSAVAALIADTSKGLYGDETRDTDGRVWWDVYGQN